MKVVLGLMCSVLLCAFALGQDAPQTVPSPQIDEKAKAILRDNEQAMFALKT